MLGDEKTQDFGLGGVKWKCSRCNFVVRGIPEICPYCKKSKDFEMVVDG